jgi:hypothetical protein
MQPPGPEPVGVSVGGIAVGGALVGIVDGAIGGAVGGALVGITWATASVGVGSAGEPEPANVQASETINNITTAMIGK